MNLLEHYILEIYSEKELTELVEKRYGFMPEERIYELDMKVVCYGAEEHVKKMFTESELRQVKENGYYMA